MLEVHRESGGFTAPVEAKRRSRPSGSKMPQRGAPHALWNVKPIPLG